MTLKSKKSSKKYIEDSESDSEEEEGFLKKLEARKLPIKSQFSSNIFHLLLNIYFQDLLETVV